MKTYILYTTSRSKEVQRQADIFAKEISQTKGRGDVQIEVKYFRPPFTIPTYKYWSDSRKEDTVSIPWYWFLQQFDKKNYNGVIFHFLPSQRTRWGLSEKIAGRKHSENKEYPAFWICSDLSKLAYKGYEGKKTLIDGETITRFLRILFHEHGHFDEDLDNEVGNLLGQDSVHDTDYKLKEIHMYHYLVDYRGMAFKEAVNKLTVLVIKLANRIF